MQTVCGAMHDDVIRLQARLAMMSIEAHVMAPRHFRMLMDRKRLGCWLGVLTGQRNPLQAGSEVLRLRSIQNPVRGRVLQRRDS
jgi:hypothetical protein